MPARPNGTSSMPAPYMSGPNIGNLNISGYSNFNPQRQNPEVKHDSGKKLPRSISSSNSLDGNMIFPSSSSAMGAGVAPGSVIWGSPGCPKPSEYIQGLIDMEIRSTATLTLKRPLSVPLSIRCPKKIPKATWDEIQHFLISSAGRSAILASQCRYEAGTILKKKCLKGHALGDILQILNMRSTATYRPQRAHNINYGKGRSLQSSKGSISMMPGFVRG
ncbi:ACID BINDING PROTEIN putative-RELATED, partial [Salix purpurea]